MPLLLCEEPVSPITALSDLSCQMLPRSLQWGFVGVCVYVCVVRVFVCVFVCVRVCITALSDLSCQMLPRSLQWGSVGVCVLYVCRSEERRVGKECVP